MKAYGVCTAQLALINITHFFFFFENQHFKLFKWEIQYFHEKICYWKKYPIYYIQMSQ